MIKIHIFWMINLILISVSTSSLIVKQNHKSHEKIVMDVDAGADDALAIQIILKNEEILKGPPLIAVTCVTGNAEVQTVKINVLRTLQQLRRTDIPVYVGANAPFFSDIRVEDFFFGNDGFGDFPYNPKTLGKSQREHAVAALIRLASSNPGQITLLALGPLTNIALALKLDNSFLKKLKKLVIMGGSVHGIGNIRPGIEFNFMRDPEAAHMVLTQSSYQKVTLFPWDTVFKTDISKEWRVDVLGALNNDDIIFINKAEAISLSKSRRWHNADSMTAASSVWPIIKSMQPLRVSAVTGGEARGGLLVDHYYSYLNVNTSNVNVVTEIDKEKFKEMLFDIHKSCISNISLNFITSRDH